MEDQENKKKYLFELKDIIILLLVIAAVWIYFNPFSKTDVATLQKAIDEKDLKIKQIEIERDSLRKDRKKIDDKVKILESSYVLRADTIKNLKRISASQRSEINDLKEGLEFYDGLIKKQSDKITQLEKNPIILPKDQILEKIKQKLK